MRRYTGSHQRLRRLWRAACVLALATLVGSATATTARAAAPPKPRVLRDWPCPGCLVVVPAGAVPRTSPVLLAVHGDEGSPDLIASVLAPVAATRKTILFAPHCPVALGCSFANGATTTSSWWGWLQSGKYDDAWLGTQLARVASRFHTQKARKFVLGWSGGADFLGWYAIRHAATFSAAAFVAGGVPYYTRCPSTTLPSYFLDGTADPRFLSGQPGQVESMLRSCGNETRVDTIANADHQGTLASLWRGKAQVLVDWLLKHRRARH